MSNFYKIFVLVFAFTGDTFAADKTNDWSRLDALERSLQEDVEQGRLAGSVLYVAHNGRTVFHKAFGWQDVEKSIPMSTASLHRIASQTKALTSVAVMILQERGRLLISDPLGKYFPEWSATTVAIKDTNNELGYRIEPAKRPITIRDLLAHTAGVNYGWIGASFGADRGVLGVVREAWREKGFEGWYFSGDNGNMREKIRLMASLPQAAHPGEAFVYGYSTDILGALVEQISGQNLERFLTENVFLPLNMKDTFFFVPDDKASRLTTVYGASPEGLVRLPDADALTNSASFFYGQGHFLRKTQNQDRSYSGGSGAVSTAADYGKFLEMLINDGTFRGKRILGRKSVELMTTDHLSPGVEFRPGAGFGLGFNIVRDIGQKGVMGSNGSYGWGGAYHSIYWVDPAENLVVSYATQLIPAGNIDDHEKIRALIYQALE